MADALLVEQVHKSAGGGQGSLDDVSFHVADSEFVAILGPSGSGKSALLLICGGLEPPERGSVVIAGQDPALLEPSARDSFLQRLVGWVLPEEGLVPVLSAIESVALAVTASGRPPAEARRTAELALEAVGLRSRGEHYVSELSAGEQRSVALARALAKAPILLVVDEPTAQLGADTAARVLDLIRSAAESGTAILLATHDPEVARRADRVLRLEGGRIQP